MSTDSNRKSHDGDDVVVATITGRIDGTDRPGVAERTARSG